MRYGILALVGLCACNENNIYKPGEEVPSGLGPPIIQVEPLEIDLITCGSTRQEVRVGNMGESDLEVGPLSMSGDGWTLDPGPADFVVAPQTFTSLFLSGTLGKASLLVPSNDEDEPEVAVRLLSTADQEPTVALTSPVADAILSIDDPVLLAAQVLDDVDDPSLLEVTFSSDLDGVLATATPDGQGVATASWAPGARSTGPHVISASVTDSCDQTAFDHQPVCQQAGYVVDQLDISTWHFEGWAAWDNIHDWLQLTDANVDQVGTAFQTSQPINAASVSIEFLFYIGGGSGADGISLTVLDVDDPNFTYLGGTGCGMGYGGDADCTAGPPLPGWSLELDTYYNAVDPTSEDHLMFAFDGDVDDPAAWVALPEMEGIATPDTLASSDWHTMRVDVTAPHITVTIDGTVRMDTDLSGDFNFQGYVGFTAGTGSLTNYHLIDALQVTDYICE